MGANAAKRGACQRMAWSLLPVSSRIQLYCRDEPAGFHRCPELSCPPQYTDCARPLQPQGHLWPHVCRVRDLPILTRYLVLWLYLKGALDRTCMLYDAENMQIVLVAHPDIVVLAGWMHIFGNGFLNAVTDA
jgi:hypothetical protein